jgi:hypothetical protein
MLHCVVHERRLDEHLSSATVFWETVTSVMSGLTRS